MAEWFFWDEFGVRFNFIAVDYLIYTTEVIGNIRESYPVEKLLLGLLFVVLVLFYLFGIKNGRLNASFIVQTNFLKRAKTGALLLLPAPFFGLFVDGSITSSISKNQFNIELAKNGPYSFFCAFKHNRLEYEKFYPVIDKAEAITLARELVAEEGREFVSKDGSSLLSITHQNPLKKPLNVMLVVMESMSADAH